MDPLKDKVQDDKDLKERAIVIKQLAIEQRIKNKPVYRCLFD